jgi:hypothetical protein
MTTSTPASFLHEIENYLPIPPDRLAYFRARLQDRIYDMIVREFLRKEEAKEMTRSSLANRIDKDPAQITRYLAGPGNWTLDTVSDFMLGICAAELEIGLRPLSSMATEKLNPKISSTNASAKYDENRLVHLDLAA